MIYTVTLNPSIDFIVRLDTLTIGEVNRMTSDDKFVIRFTSPMVKEIGRASCRERV